jgi:uncharacterized membrane protein YfhO
MRIENAHEETLIIREMWDQGWIARADGSPIKVYPHQGTFIGLRIPAGAHNLILEYNPVPVTLGLMTSTTTIASVLGILALTRIRRY